LIKECRCERRKTNVRREGGAFVGKVTLGEAVSRGMQGKYPTFHKYSILVLNVS